MSDWLAVASGLALTGLTLAAYIVWSAPRAARVRRRDGDKDDR